MRSVRFVLATVGVLFVLTTAAACGGGSPANAGQIIFGTTIDASAMKVTAPVTTVSAATPLGWVAYLTAAVNATSMTLTVARLEGSAENPVGTIPVSVSNPAFNQFAHQPDLSLNSEGPGTYKLRYIRPSDNKVLAEGTIEITP